MVSVQKKNSKAKSISLTRDEWKDLEYLQDYLGVSRSDVVRILISASKMVMVRQCLESCRKK